MLIFVMDLLMTLELECTGYQIKLLHASSGTIAYMNCCFQLYSSINPPQLCPLSCIFSLDCHALSGESNLYIFCQTVVTLSISFQDLSQDIQDATHGDMLAAQNKVYIHLYEENLKLTGSLETLKYVLFFLGPNYPDITFLQESI
jgi:hypothetical protein